MAPQRYRPVATRDDDDDNHAAAAAAVARPDGPAHSPSIPSSPPPSFRSRASSPATPNHPLMHRSPVAADADADADRTLADTFDAPDDGSDDELAADGADERQRLMRAHASESASAQTAHAAAGPRAGGNEVAQPPPPRMGIQRRVTELPAFAPQSSSARGRIYGGGQNDGVFANLSAKPTRGGDEVDEKPPTYEQAAADASPPYWETTILAPGMVGDEVFVGGLPVGTVFSFVWNAMISMSFQLIGFLLTYLLHTTHAAKNGSRAGLGITLVQTGFTMKSSGALSSGGPDDANAAASADGAGAPDLPADFDPTAHDFDPTAVSPPPSSGGAAMPASSGAAASAAAAASSGGLSTSDWLAYALMVVGWFILIKAISDYVRARRHEQLVLQSPDRGLGVAVVAEGEPVEHAV